MEAADVSYTLEQVSLYGGGGKPPWFMKLNPKGQVPILVINNNKDTNKIVLADSDQILDEMGMVMAAATAIPTQSATSTTQLVTDSDDDRVAAFRSILNEFLPIGKSAVLGGDKERMWSKLRELDALIDVNTIEGQSYIIAGDEPTVADCAGFPFLWRIDQEFSSGSWENNGCQNIPVWLEFCKKQPAFANSIQSSWWWWW